MRSCQLLSQVRTDQQDHAALVIDPVNFSQHHAKSPLNKIMYLGNFKTDGPDRGASAQVAGSVLTLYISTKAATAKHRVLVTDRVV